MLSKAKLLSLTYSTNDGIDVNVTHLEKIVPLLKSFSISLHCTALQRFTFHGHIQSGKKLSGQFALYEVKWALFKWVFC